MRERPGSLAVPPFGAVERLTVPDPQPASTVLRTGHRNRLKPPFELRQSGASTFSDWKRTTEGMDRARSQVLLQAGEAARYRRKSTLDPRNRPHHIQP
jgi:hypothetical protein